MPVNLNDHVDSLKREVIPLGSDLFSDISDSVFRDHLIDGFWDAKLDGFLQEWDLSVGGVVSPDGFPRELVALCVIYAGVKILSLQLVNTEAHFRATAGPVGFETRTSATVMAEMLRQLERRKLELKEALISTDVTMVDALTTRTLSVGSYGGWVNDYGGW